MSAVSVWSLGLRTDLMLVGFEGRVTVRDGVIEARTPSSPSYYYGNFLLWPSAPRPGDAAAWIARFGDAFADDPRIRHVCLRWDSPDGDEGAAAELAELGFTLDRGVVLVTDEVREPPRRNQAATVRAVVSDADWAAVAELQVRTAVDSFGEGVEAWARDMVAFYRRQVELGRGLWLAAFDGPAADAPLAADLGVFAQDGVARFQSVETALAYRRQGLCATLVVEAARLAKERLGARTLVMVADPGYHAARIYESVGFVPRERLISAYRRPPPP